jgi:DNA-binding response OmpR family regulator
MPAKILLVEDDKDVRDLLNIVLEGDGYCIDVAENVEAAMKLIASTDYDILLIDKNMPGLDGNGEGGLDLLRHVRSQSSPPEVIMITGHPTVGSAIEAMKLGAFDYVTKPFSIADIRFKVKKLSDFRSFINPDYIIGLYRRLQRKMFELIEQGAKMPDRMLEGALLSVNDEIDRLFIALKDTEKLILAERESLSHIASLAERLKTELRETDDNYDLVDKICRFSDERL